MSEKIEIGPCCDVHVYDASVQIGCSGESALVESEGEARALINLLCDQINRGVLK